MNDGLFGELPIDLDAQIKCVDRELGLRHVVYPRRVDEKKMSQRKMDEEIAAMMAVKASLERLRSYETAKDAHVHA